MRYPYRNRRKAQRGLRGRLTFNLSINSNLTPDRLWKPVGLLTNSGRGTRRSPRDNKPTLPQSSSAYQMKSVFGVLRVNIWLVSCNVNMFSGERGFGLICHPAISNDFGTKTIKTMRSILKLTRWQSRKPKCQPKETVAIH
jgi:hypothetical protein